MKECQDTSGEHAFFLSYCNNENIRYGKVIEEVIERNKNKV